MVSADKADSWRTRLRRSDACLSSTAQTLNSHLSSRLNLFKSGIHGPFSVLRIDDYQRELRSSGRTRGDGQIKSDTTTLVEPISEASSGPELNGGQGDH